MMTLILITMMMGIVAVILAQSSRLSHLGESGFSQSASLRVITDLEHLFPTLLSAIHGAEELDLAMRLPLQLETKKGDFNLKISLSSPYNKLNINNLITPDGVIDDGYLALMNKLLATHPIADPDIFLKLIFDTIDTDNAERGIDTEIGQNRTDFKNGVIADTRQFTIILERYIAITRDTAVLAIDWENYIGYEGAKMDINAINATTLSLILPTVPEEKIRSMTEYRTKAYASKEEAIAAEPALAPLFDKYFFLYRPDTSYTLVCDLRINENFKENHLLFRYNLLDKKVQRVEFL